jgi:HAD superfamily hydrolase (TIGR01509 family)
MAAAQLGRKLDVDDIEAIRLVVENTAIQAPVIDGVDTALAQIPLPKACASNSHEPYIRAVLARTGLSAFFGDHVFCADMVAKPKPAPDIYLAASERFGIEPDACLVVEDSVTGATAAHAAGMSVFGFTGGGHTKDAQMDALLAAGAQQVFDDMHRLPALVAQWMLHLTSGS